MVTDEDVKKAETLKAELQKVIDHFNECEEVERLKQEEGAMSNEQDILIWKLDKELARARLALGKIYTIVGSVYCWDVGHAMSKLERDDVDKIVKTLQEYFGEEKQ